VAAAAVAVPLYSRLLTAPADLLDPVRALGMWGERAVAGEGHEKPWWYFCGLLAREEWAVLAAASAGAVIAWRRRDRAALGLLAWAAAALVSYSAIPYKTPWLAINIVLPLALLGGFGVGAALEAAASKRLRAALLLMVVVAAGGSAARAFDVAVRRPDADGASPLVYVQTRRDALRLVSRLEEYAARHPEGRRLPVAILSPDYLPLNWYLRDFENVGYHGRLIEPLAGPVVIGRVEDAAAIAERLGPRRRQEDYDLRPGVRLALFLEEPPGGL
jgi:predicted membrane-bound mannosyltransferase